MNKALWYKVAAKELGIELKYTTFAEKMKNVTERTFMLLKKRVKAFFKRCPPSSKYETVWSWIASFLTFHLTLFNRLSLHACGKQR